MINLIDAKKSKWYFVKKIEDCEHKVRLMEMGFCNCNVMLIKVGLGKKDYLFLLRGFKIILRKDLVQNIWVEELLR